MSLKAIFAAAFATFLANAQPQQAKFLANNLVLLMLGNDGDVLSTATNIVSLAGKFLCRALDKTSIIAISISFMLLL